MMHLTVPLSDKLLTALAECLEHDEGNPKMADDAYTDLVDEAAEALMVAFAKAHGKTWKGASEDNL